MVVQVMIPVMVVMLGGYLFGRRYSNGDFSSLTKLAMTVLSPALIFSFLIRNPLSSSEMVQITLTVLVFTLFLTIITLVAMKWTGHTDHTIPGLLATVFPNTGNFGLPVLLLAYGEEAFAQGVVIVVLNFMLMYSLGIGFASWQETGWRKVADRLVRLPTTYAALLAVVINLLHIPIPDFIYLPVKMVGDTMVPVALLILGMQLSTTKVRGYAKVTLILTIIRVLVSPLVIFAIVYLGDIHGTLAKVLILQHSMPTAVVMTIIAGEYKAGAELVANVSLLSTLLSFLTITGLLYFLDLLPL